MIQKKNKKIPAIRFVKRSIQELDDLENEMLLSQAEKTTIYFDKIDKIKTKLFKQLTFMSIGFFAALFVIVYIICKLIDPDFGHNINNEYYQILASILPALLIALFLSGSRKTTPLHSKKVHRTPWGYLMRNDTLEGLIGFSVGEVACLIAIASGVASSVLFLATLFSLVLIIPATFAKVIYGDLDSY